MALPTMTLYSHRKTLDHINTVLTLSYKVVKKDSKRLIPMAMKTNKQIIIVPVIVLIFHRMHNFIRKDKRFLLRANRESNFKRVKVTNVV